VQGAALLGGEVCAASVLHGGDLSEIIRITLADGREAVVKASPAARVEAAMLQAIAASGAPVPAVLAVSDTLLVMAVAQTGGGIGQAWASLGGALAKLHAVTGEFYGWHTDYAFGAVAIDNRRTDDWPAFWGLRRLLPHLPHVSAVLGRRLEVLAAGLASRLPETPRAALLHGDLWGGNVLAADGAVTGLIDPACYYGHGEVDLAMLRLFDRPADVFTDIYGAPEPGYGERLPVYQLWPALVHLRLFGDSYRPMVERFLSAAGV
jgi:fructosamine-3-kinase